MFVEAHSVPDGSVIEADVCIVGAGAAGITIARELSAGGGPLKVALLEAGGFTPDMATQSLYAGRTEGQPYFPLDSSRSRCFGGTTEQWAGECRPLDALDFDVRDWVPGSGWPFSLAELLPFYERAQALCQLGPFAYAAADWLDDGVRPTAFNRERIRSLVIHYSPPTRFGEVYRDDIGRSTSVTAYLGANVIEIETPAPPSQVSAVRVACLSGSRFDVRARTFILAAGGIENARLLLMSNRVQAAGLGNGHDQVGRCFMEHLYLDEAAQLIAPAHAISEFYTTGHHHAGRRVRGILALSPEVQRQERLTNFCAILDDTATHAPPVTARSFLGSLRRGHLPLRVRARLRSGRTFLVKNVMEQAPNPESRILLGPDCDAFGCPRVILRWRLSDIDKHTMHRAHEILAEETSAAAIGRFNSAQGRESDPWPAGLRGARHHMGTTRMHHDPRYGVVDAEGRVHGIANLFVAGSSVFPTSGTANPMLTLIALALRMADRVRSRF